MKVTYKKTRREFSAGQNQFGLKFLLFFFFSSGQCNSLSVKYELWTSFIQMAFVNFVNIFNYSFKFCQFKGVCHFGDCFHENSLLFLGDMI